MPKEDQTEDELSQFIHQNQRNNSEAIEEGIWSIFKNNILCNWAQCIYIFDHQKKIANLAYSHANANWDTEKYISPHTYLSTRLNYFSFIIMCTAFVSKPGKCESINQTHALV